MRTLARLLLALGALLACLVVTAAPASAHPLGNFTVNRYTGILVSPDGVEVDHVVDLAEIPTAQLGDAIDDLPALAARECATTTDGLAVTAGGDGVRLELEDATASVSDGEGGLPVTRITCRYSGAADIGAGEVTFEDSTAPGSVGWREVTAVGDEMTLTSADVPSESTSERLTSYPEDLLESPLDVTSATLVVATGGPAGSCPAPRTTDPVSPTAPGCRRGPPACSVTTGGWPQAWPSSPRSPWARRTHSRPGTARPSWRSTSPSAGTPRSARRSRWAAR